MQRYLINPREVSYQLYQVTHELRCANTRIGELEDVLDFIARRHTMDGLTAIQARSIARAILKPRAEARG